MGSSFKNLKIWQRGKHLAKLAYLIIENSSKNEIESLRRILWVFRKNLKDKIENAA